MKTKQVPLKPWMLIHAPTRENRVPFTYRDVQKINREYLSASGYRCRKCRCSYSAGAGPYWGFSYLTNDEGVIRLVCGDESVSETSCDGKLEAE